MKRVLHIIDHPGLGGAQRVVADIVNHSDDAFLIALRYRNKSIRQIHTAKDKYLLTPARSLPWLVISLLRLPWIIRKNRVEIVHCHLFLSWLAGLWASIFFLGQKTPIFIFHEHDSVRLEKWYYRFLIKMAGRSGKIVAVSEYIKNVLLLLINKNEDIPVVKNAIDLDYFHPIKDGMPEKQQSFPVPIFENGMVLGFASRLIGYKGWEYILELADLLKDENIYFLIAGDGADYKIIESMIIQEGLESKVRLLGYVDQMDIFYNSIDALLVTTQKDAFGLVQLESQACGVPVIVFDSPSSREIQGDHSLIIVPNGDIKKMAEYVRKIKNDKAYKKYLIELGLKNAQNYSLKNYLKQIDYLYESLGS